MSTTNERQITDEVEKTLQSFDNDAPLEGNPFLASRIKAEINSRLHKRHQGFLFGINLRYAAVVLILLINLITAVHYFGWSNAHNLHERLVSELEEEFQIDQSRDAF